nr:hypothetical protein GCM10020093_090400 [Planobispora longispora]
MSSAGETLVASERPSSRSRSWSAEGRSAGALASAALTTLRSGSGMEVTSTSWLRMRFSTTAIEPPEKDVSPVAANAMVAPQAKTSVYGPTSSPEICSGAM